MDIQLIVITRMVESNVRFDMYMNPAVQQNRTIFKF